MSPFFHLLPLRSIVVAYWICIHDNMDSPEFSAGGKPSSGRKELQLQGPRPSPLKVRKESYAIKKPPLAPQPQPLSGHPAPLAKQPPPNSQPAEPIVIYTVSPKVIHANVSDFMTVVQRLTGNWSSGEADGAGQLSPAARLASIEKTSPSKRERDGVVELDDQEGDGLGRTPELRGRQIPGILSPVPADIPAVLPGFFSPASDPHSLSWLHDLSSLFLPSPSSSTLFPSPVFSPTLSFDLFS